VLIANYVEKTLMMKHTSAPATATKA
jgi:hypothetical protein